MLVTWLFVLEIARNKVYNNTNHLKVPYLRFNPEETSAWCILTHSVRTPLASRCELRHTGVPRGAADRHIATTRL